MSDNLDSEEKKLLSSFEKDEWKSIKNVKKEKVRSRKIAANTIYQK